MTKIQPLLTPYKMGDLLLKNRLVIYLLGCERTKPWRDTGLKT